jgi:phospholipid/cholesterol/gamma-HCH transport system ATP-binding protein
MEPSDPVAHSPDNDLVVRVRGLVNQFGAQVVHNDLSFEVRRNEIMGIVGGSGAGKSVLLHTILGLREPQAGTVEVFGRNIRELSPAERLAMTRAYGVTFQSGALISSLSVAENIQLPLREAYSLDESLLDDLVQLNLSLVGLAPDAAEKYPSQLSGGMVKRAALARALSLEPKLLFLDALLLYLHGELKLTVVMITHDLDSLFRTCNRVSVIVDGHMVSDTLPGILKSTNPWIREYFHGPRARGAELAAEAGPLAEAPRG